MNEKPENTAAPHDELLNVLLHTGCNGKIESRSLTDRDGAAELLKRLGDEGGGKYSISTMPESLAAALPICRCDYDFPEIIYNPEE